MFSHPRLKNDGHLQSEPLGGAVVVQLKSVEAAGVTSEGMEGERWKERIGSEQSLVNTDGLQLSSVISLLRLQRNIDLHVRDT